MADLTPVSTFSPVYQLETTDQVLAGVGGIANRQAQQLANRTQYLFDNMGGGGASELIVATPANFPGLDPTGNPDPAAVTANTLALQAFFDACRGKRGYIPPGWYRKNAAIVMDPQYSYHIEGAGWTSENTITPPWGTVIEDTNDSFGLFIYYTFANNPGGPANNVPPKSNSDNRVYLAHFRLRGPRTFALPGNTSVGIEGVNTLMPKGTGIFCYWVQGLKLTNVWIDGYQANGIYAYRCFSVVLEDVWTIKNNFSGIVFYKTANAIRMTGIKSLVNGRVPNVQPHYSVIISSDNDNFFSGGPVIDGSSDVSYCGGDSSTPSYFSVGKGNLTNITVAGGVATCNGTGFNYLAGQVVSVSGCTVNRAVNSLYPATILTATFTQLTFTTNAPNGVYNEASLAVSPCGIGIGLNHIFGGQINAYCEDPSNVGIYVGASCKGLNIEAGYYQDARILVDTGARGVSVGNVLFAGIRGGDHWAEASSIGCRVSNQYYNLPGRGLAAASSGDGLLQSDSALTVQGIYLGRGVGGEVSNLALGLGSLRNLIPSGALEGKFNSVFGRYAGESLTTGYGNLFMGDSAGRAVTSGFLNIAIGRNSLADWPNAQRMVVIGDEAGQNVISGGSEILIGYRAGRHGTPSGTTGQNVFIGDNAGGASAGQAYGSCVMIGYNSTASSIASGVTNYIGIGVNTNAFAQVNTIRMGNTAISSAVVQVAWTISSDSRLKNDVINLPSNLGLSFINAIRPVAYRRVNSESLARVDREMGFIAQEVATATPAGYELVNVGIDGFYGLRYNDFIAPVVKAIQELDAKIVALTARVTALE